MRRRNIVTASVVTALLFALPAGSAFSQTKSLKEQLVGAWTRVSGNYKFPDGTMRPTTGADGRGLMIFDASGHTSFISMRASLPKFAANSRMNGTPEENKAVVQGSFAYFGTYTVNEADHTYTLKIEASTYPNFDGTTQKRSFVIAGDELKSTNPVATLGKGVVVETVWKRAK